ncbi:hypothetical protein GCM10023223_53350 [Stackebrandtia albiflava]
MSRTDSATTPWPAATAIPAHNPNTTEATTAGHRRDRCVHTHAPATITAATTTTRGDTHNPTTAPAHTPAATPANLRSRPRPPGERSPAAATRHIRRHTVTSPDSFAKVAGPIPSTSCNSSTESNPPLAAR